MDAKVIPVMVTTLTALAYALASEVRAIYIDQGLAEHTAGKLDGIICPFGYVHSSCTEKGA